MVMEVDITTNICYLISQYKPFLFHFLINKFKIKDVFNTLKSCSKSHLLSAGEMV